MGENGISISDKKHVKVDVFEDTDLLSDEEKAAMAEEIDGDPDADAEAAAKAEAKADADKEAQEAADAKKKEEDEAKLAEDQAVIEKAEADKKEADAAAALAKTDEGAKAGDEAGGKEAGDADKAVSVPQSAPTVAMQTLSDDEVQGIKEALEDAKKRFQNGEIDYEKYYDERSALDQQLWTNNVAMQLSVDSVESNWQWEQQTFLNAEENKWINDDEVVYAALSATVNRIMSTSEGAVMPGTEILSRAREEVAARFSPTQAADTQSAADDKAKAAALKAAKDTQAGKQLPDTLAGVGAAEAEAESVGEFAYLDKLDGEKFEQAVEGLSEAQLARYEANV